MRYPTVYRDDLADRILDGIAEGRTVADMCRELDVKRATMMSWVHKDHSGFRDRFYAARQLAGLHMLDEIRSIADDCPPTAIHIGKAKLQIEARKWLLEKLWPGIFADANTKLEDDEVEVNVLRGKVVKSLDDSSPASLLAKWKSDRGIETKQ